MSLRDTLEVIHQEAVLTQGMTDIPDEAPAPDQLEEMIKEIHLSVSNAKLKNLVFVKGTRAQQEAAPPPTKARKKGSRTTASRLTPEPEAQQLVVQKTVFDGTADSGSVVTDLVQLMPFIPELQDSRQDLHEEPGEKTSREIHAENLFMANLLKDLLGNSPDNILSSPDRQALSECTQAASTGIYK